MTGLIFTTVRRIVREYKGILCRGSPVPLCKGAGTKQLKVDYFDCATWCCRLYIPVSLVNFESSHCCLIYFVEIEKTSAKDKTPE